MRSTMAEPSGTREPDGYMCPVCKHAGSTPFSCGGPHPNIRKDGTLGRRRVYRFVQARPVRFCEHVIEPGGVIERPRGESTA